MAERQYYPRETLGALIQTRAFILHIVCFTISLIIFVILHGIQFWFNIMIFSSWAVCGLITANYLGTIVPVTSLLSWILVDQNSWLVNTIILFCTGTLFVICGMHLFLEMNRSNHSVSVENMTPLMEYLVGLNATTQVNLWGRYFYIVNIFVSINFFQGVFYVIFGYYCCLTMDSDRTD